MDNGDRPMRNGGGKGDGVLGGRIVRGGMWLAAGNGAEQALKFVRNIILARIVAPQSFGEMAIVLAIAATLESFTEIGVKEAVIHSPDGDRRGYLNAAWWISLGRSVAIYIAAFACAAPIAGFYENPALAGMMRVAFLVILFNGMISPAAHVAVKRMAFRRWILFYQGAGVVGVATTLILVGILRSHVWALVIGFTAENAARCLLSYIVFPFRPDLSFERASANAIFRYTRGMLGLPILAAVSMRAELFVLGKMAPPDQVGLYTMAALLARMPFVFVASILNRVMLPMFAEVQGEKAEINRYVLRFSLVLAMIGMPATVSVLLYGRDILSLVYGKAYGAVSVPFAILFVSELLRMTSTPLIAVYLGTGHPGTHRLFTGVRLLLQVVLIVPAVRVAGLAGAAFTGLFAMAAAYVVQVVQMRRLSGLGFGKYMASFNEPLKVSVLLVVPWIITGTLMPSHRIMNLAIGAAGCLAVYGHLARRFVRTHTECAGLFQWGIAQLGSKAKNG